MGVVDVEEHRFIAVGNEICFYFRFAIGYCCQSDPIGSIDDATRKSMKFLVAMNSFSSSSSSDCAGHWIALACGSSTTDFVLRKIEEMMKCLFLFQWTTVPFLLWENNDINELTFANPKEMWSWQAGSFFAGSDSIRVDLLYNVQNKNGMSHSG